MQTRRHLPIQPQHLRSEPYGTNPPARRSLVTPRERATPGRNTTSLGERPRGTLTFLFLDGMFTWENIPELGTATHPAVALLDDALEHDVRATWTAPCNCAAPRSSALKRESLGHLRRASETFGTQRSTGALNTLNTRPLTLDVTHKTVILGAFRTPMSSTTNWRNRQQIPCLQFLRWT